MPEALAVADVGEPGPVLVFGLHAQGQVAQQRPEFAVFEDPAGERDRVEAEREQQLVEGAVEFVAAAAPVLADDLVQGRFAETDGWAGPAEGEVDVLEGNAEDVAFVEVGQRLGGGALGAFGADAFQVGVDCLCIEHQMYSAA